MNELCDLAANNLDALTWYDNALAECRHVAHAEGISLERFASVLALTSPRCSVRRNVRIALSYCVRGEYPRNTLRAIRTSVRNWETTGDIRGPKVSAFRRAILGDDTAIVLDVHMANLYGIDQKYLSQAKHRRPIEESVRTIAREIGQSPRDTQACLWFGRKRSIGENPEGFPIRQEYANFLAYGRRFPLSGTILVHSDKQGNYQPCLFANHE